MPGPRGTHRHPAQDDPVSVNRVIAAGRLDGLEDVGLSGPSVAVLDAAQRVELEVPSVRGILSGGFGVVESAHESEFAHPRRPAAAVQHDVQAQRPGRVVPRRDDHAERLHRAVHRGDETADNAALLAGPWRPARLQVRDPRPARLERPRQDRDVGRRELGVVSECPGDALGVDLGIGEAVGLHAGRSPFVDSQSDQALGQFSQAALELLPLIRIEERPCVISQGRDGPRHEPSGECPGPSCNSHAPSLPRKGRPRSSRRPIVGRRRPERKRWTGKDTAPTLRIQCSLSGVRFWEGEPPGESSDNTARTEPRPPRITNGHFRMSNSRNVRADLGGAGGKRNGDDAVSLGRLAAGRVGR